jgi:hypothetical protein
LVGDNGTVVGVDRSLVAAKAASARAVISKYRNVSFRQGDPTEMTTKLTRP